MDKETSADGADGERARLDKWLWAARFFKTRALARDAVDNGRVRVNAARVKPARVLRVGDVVDIRIGELTWRITVRDLSDRRGPASRARELYDEDPASREARERRIDAERLAREPARALHGRPTKRDRRMIHRFTE